MRLKHFAVSTEKTYLHWIKRYIFFNNKKHPEELGGGHVAQFVTHLAAKENVSASTQNQALCALMFLYKVVLGREIDDLTEIGWSKVRRRLPVVLTEREVARIISHLDGVQELIVLLLYGAGLRLRECLRLRVKDIDFERG